MSSTPIVEGWFTTGSSPALLGSRCADCGAVSFPPLRTSCPRPTCLGQEFDAVELSRTGTVWSYTNAQYQPPAPFVPAAGGHVPFGLAAVQLPEGLVVLGQLAQGYGVDDVRVGSPVELVVETLHGDETGDRTIWRWKPTEEKR